MNSYNSSDAVKPEEQARLLSTIENWKRKLLDVSKRNRSLNFRPLRVSTVSIVDELPEVVFSKLWINGNNMRFAASESPSDSSISESNDMLDELLQGDGQVQNPSAQQMELLPGVAPSAIASGEPLYSNTEHDQRQADNLLQTSLDSDKLDRSLRRLDEQTRSALDEQGVNVLFLALGMLRWIRVFRVENGSA